MACLCDQSQSGTHRVPEAIPSCDLCSTHHVLAKACTCEHVNMSFFGTHLYLQIALAQMMHRWFQRFSTSSQLAGIPHVPTVLVTHRPHHPASARTTLHHPALGYGAQGVGHRVRGTGCGAQGMGHRVWGTVYAAQGMGHRVWGTGYAAQGMGHSVCGTVYAAQGVRHRV